MQPEQANHPLNDHEAHRYAMSLPIGDVVAALVRILGATTVAVIGGVTETRAVQQWTNGREPHRQHVLRFALQIACMVVDADNQYEAARAWFQGSNPALDDAIPALLLRDEPLEKIQAPLMKAARDFASR
ncbi:MAG TPA: hypothetical protein VIO32_12570 [Candidatus Baltobacteraceae bacterium]